MSKDSGLGGFCGGLALGLLMGGNNSGGGASKPPSGGDGDGCGVMIFLWVLGLYMFYCVGKFLWELAVACYPWDIYVGASVAVIVWVVNRISKKKAALKAAEDHRLFMMEFHNWEMGIRAQGDNSMYCPACRGEFLPENKIGREYHCCQLCKGTGIREEKPSDKFIRDFQQWEMSKRVLGDETKYCMYCRGEKIARVDHEILDDETLAWRRDLKANYGGHSSWLNYETGEATYKIKCNHCKGTGVRDLTEKKTKRQGDEAPLQIKKRSGI